MKRAKQEQTDECMELIKGLSKEHQEWVLIFIIGLRVQKRVHVDQFGNINVRIA